MQENCSRLSSVLEQRKIEGEEEEHYLSFCMTFFCICLVSELKKKKSAVILEVKYKACNCKPYFVHKCIYLKSNIFHSASSAI